jgi:hypothetical protein
VIRRPIFARESPDFRSGRRIRRLNSARKWQSAEELLEKSWQQFGNFACGAIVGVARSVHLG